MFFSIVTINYNNADGLRRSIKSVITQSSHDYEYIVFYGERQMEALMYELVYRNASCRHISIVIAHFEDGGISITNSEISCKEVRAELEK